VAYVTIRGLNKHFAGKPPTTAIDELDLEIEEGEFLVLLGPSGCGKTTTLRCLAGLETPNSGSIAFGGHTVFDSGSHVDLSPDKRNIGMVFQSYALWPHMTVRKNIGYPLRARRIPKAQCQGWIEDTAELVDCGGLLDRYPAQLSGGQQQRVALARGLVARPDLVLFDEPLSNLDARLRDQVRAQIHELHTRLRFTAVFVTHDQREALALGDRLAIMKSGKLEQFDTPEHVFEEPATEYVAGFIGMSNRLGLERTAVGWTLDGRTITGELPVPRDCASVAVRLRPDDVVLTPAERALDGDGVAVPAEIVDSQFGGRHFDVVVKVGGHRLDARVPSGPSGGWARHLTMGQPVTISFPSGSAVYFDVDGSRVAGHVPAQPAMVAAEAPIAVGV
jgi:iron(III) transport system ATP-binding protein